ncbi:MAG: hypothetical protein QME41_07225 [Actinomycetota bacterium]|nr:hypothetical protein [Actinomycetota bacterium]
MRRSKVLAVILAVGAILVAVAAVGYGVRNEATATQASRYKQLENLNAGYKERAAKLGIPNADQVPILRQGNKGSENIKPVEQMKGYVAETNYKDGAYYETKETLTYEEFINKYTAFDLDPSIAKERIINVTVARFPNGFQHKRGFVKNAILVKVYDAETGDFFGSSIRSLDPGGMGISKGNPVK